MTDRAEGAGMTDRQKPLTPEEEAEVRQRDTDVPWTAVFGTARWTDEAAWAAVDDRRRLLATLDAARQEAADTSGLREALERIARNPAMTVGKARSIARDALSQEPTPDERPLDVERLMDAEHRWCVQVEGDYALRHEVEAHRPQAEFIAARLSAAGE